MAVGYDPNIVNQYMQPPPDDPTQTVGQPTSDAGAPGYDVSVVNDYMREFQPPQQGPPIPDATQSVGEDTSTKKYRNPLLEGAAYGVGGVFDTLASQQQGSPVGTQAAYDAGLP